MELLTIKDVADRLQVSETTVERLIARGDLIATKVGTLVRVTPSDLDAYLQAARVVR